MSQCMAGSYQTMKHFANTYLLHYQCITDRQGALWSDKHEGNRQIQMRKSLLFYFCRKTKELILQQLVTDDGDYQVGRLLLAEERCAQTQLIRSRITPFLESIVVVVLRPLAVALLNL